METELLSPMRRGISAAFLFLTAIAAPGLLAQSQAVLHWASITNGQKVQAGTNVVPYCQSTGGYGTVTVTVYRDGSVLQTQVGGAGAVPCTSSTNSFSTFTASGTDTGGAAPAPLGPTVIKFYVADTQPPTDPGSVAATNLQPNSFTLAWNKSTDNQVIDYYRIKVNGIQWGNQPAGNPPTPGTEPASYSVGITGLNQGTTYPVSVTAFDWAGNASNEVIINVTTPVPDTAPPSQPGALSFSGVTYNSATVSWGASSDNVGVTGYTLTLSQGGTTVRTDSTTGTTWNYTGLNPNLGYSVSVVAKDAANNVSAASTGTFSTAGVTVPMDLTVSNVQANTFTLSWSPVVDGSVVSYYEIEVNGSVAGGQNSFGTTLFRTIGGLSPNTTYSVRVRAVNSAGVPSAWSAYLSVTTDVAQVALGAVTRPSGTGTLVAAAGAAVSVDNHGSANYSIPLQIAPGRGGLQPSLSLTYSSSGGNGVVGLGWSLSTGFPSGITRGRSILARDGEVRGVTFTSADKFYLDGKRLVLISGTYGSPGSVYRTEVESFVSVTAVGTGYIDHFDVVDKNGVKMTFGVYGSETDAFQRGGSDSNQSAYTYALKRVEDTLGNFVAYNYAPLGGGEYVLDHIDYTGGPSIAADARVEFSYENRVDQPVTWLAGRYFNHRARLAVITAKSRVAGNLTTTAAYGLNYDPAPAGLRSRLTSVGPVLADPTTQALVNVPATQISWQNYNDNLDAGRSVGGGTPGADTNIEFGDTDGDGSDDAVVTVTQPSGSQFTATRLVDIDGDGKKDRAVITVTLLSNPSNASISCGVTLAKDGTVVGVPMGNYFDDPPNGLPTAQYVLFAEGIGAGSRITFADFNGDGRDDVLLHGMDGKIHLLISNGTSFAAPSPNPAASPNMGGYGVVFWDTPHFPYGGIRTWIDDHYYVKPMPCDLNGDGRTDYVCLTYNRMVSTQAPGAYTFIRYLWGTLSKPDGTFSAPFSINTFVPANTNGGSGVPSGALKLDDINSGAFPGDFNGDGLTDFLVLDNKNINGYRWLLLINKGEDSASKVWFELHPGAIPNTVTLPGGETVNTYYTPMLSDNPGGSPGYKIGAVSNFFGIDPQKTAMYAGFEGAAGATNNFVMDINHDGLPDLVWYVRYKSNESPTTTAGWWCMLATGTYPAIGSPTPTGFTGPYPLPQFNAVNGGNAAFQVGTDFTAASLNRNLDYNGDGQPDYFYQVTTSGRPAPIGTVFLTKAADLTSLAPFGDLVSSITDGLGRTTSVAYKAAKDRSIYTSGAPVSYPIREQLGSNPVVSDVWQDSGVNGQPAQFSYQYSGSRTDLSGRGSLGFHSFITLDRQTNLFKYQFLAQSFPMTGLTHREETYRYWPSGGTTANFRFISSHDNTVVFDKVSPAGATLWPFISQAVEYRWEDSTSAHFSTTLSGSPESKPEFLFLQAKPAGAHITITAQSLFDNQTGVQLTLPGVTGYNPSDFSGSANTVVGTANADPSVGASTFNGLPGAITYGNLKQLSTDYGGGFTETVITTYKTPVGALTGLVDTISTSVTSPAGNDVAPVKRYNYFGTTPLVADETVDATDNALDLKTTYTRDTPRGRVTNTQITNATATGLQAIGDYSVSSASAFDDRWDKPTTSLNAAPYQHPTTTVYHPFLGLPTSVTDVNGAQVTTAYDALGRVLTQTDVLKGLSTANSYAFDTSQSVAPPTNWTGVDAGSPITGVTGVTLTSAYKITTTATVKPTVSTWYDRLGRPIRTVKDGFNGQQIYTDTAYNNLGQVIATSLPYLSGGNVKWTKTTYDPLGRVSTVTAPNGTVTTNTYIGRATQVSVDAPLLGGVDPAPQVNVTLVDPKGRTVSVWNSDNSPGTIDPITGGSTTPSISFALDGFGRMRATTLKGQTSAITATYDALGRQTALNDPDKGNWTYLNNALGQVVSQADGNTATTASTFDHLGRPLSRTTTGAGATETASFYYYDTDAAKPNTVAKGATGWVGAPEREECNATGSYPTTNLHYYDSKGRSWLELAKSDGKWFYTYSSYDAYSRPQQTRHYWKPSGAEDPAQQPYEWQNFGYNYSYDSRSYLLALTDTLNRSWWDTPAYDYMDRVTSVRKGNALVTTRTYRAEDGVLTGISTGGGSIQNETFGFDGLGNLTSRSDIGVSESFGYDNLNRLTTQNSNTIAAYLTNGNIGSKTAVSGGSVTINSYDSIRPHAVSSYTFGGTTYAITYDGNGNLLTRSGGSETWSMKWTGFDKPRWMAKTTGSTTAGSEFHYNANRSRVLQLEFDQMNAGAPSRYVRKRTYALGSTLELNYTTPTPSASPTWVLDTVRIYVPGPDGIIGAREFRPASGGTEKALVYHYDHLGSITAITDWGAPSGYSLSSGNKTGRYSEDPWGQRRDPLTWSGGVTASTDSGGPTGLTPRGFTGHEMLDDLGLVHMNGRIYDPLLGRMLSADSTVPGEGNLQAYNRYAYVLNNPLRFDDPDGRAPRDVAAGVIEGPAYALVNSGSAQSAAPLIDAANTNRRIAMVANFFGAKSIAESALRQAEKYEKAAADTFRGGELVKADISERVSKFTGSEDVNHPQRAAARNVTETATVVAGSYAAAKLTDRLTRTSEQEHLQDKVPQHAPLQQQPQQQQAQQAQHPELQGPGLIPNENVVVKGGTTPPPAPGTEFSASHGADIAQAGAGVPHGQVQTTTAGAIRDAGGSVTLSPEPTRGGTMNYQHVNVVEATSPTAFKPPQPNPTPKPKRVGEPGYEGP